MATQYSNKPIVTNGLVYALDFGNQKSYVSGSTSAFNLVYSTTTSSLNSYNSGQKGVVIGNLYQFTMLDGHPYISSSYFLTQALTFLDTASEYTVTAIVEPKAGNYSGEPRYLASNLTAAGRTWGITYGTSGFTQYGINDGNASIYSRQYPVGTSRQHVTYRYKSGSFDFFVNGVPVSASAINPSTFFRYQYGGGLTIGSPLDYLSPTPQGYAFSGSLGLFYIYNRALSSNEIYSNYLIAAQRYGLPTPAKPYSLDENAYLFLQSAGITDPIITSSINTFVLGLKSASLWDKMIAIYPFVGTGSVGVNLTGSHRWNLKEPSLVTYPLSFTGSWNGSVSGSTPSGSGTNITAGGITPSTYYPNYSSSNAHISILSYDTPTSSSMLAGTGMTREVAVSTLAGDYGTPAAAYSVRKVRTAYSGALMDVRRSIDNVTQSIGYVSNGDLDTGSLLNFANAVGENSPGSYSGLAAAYSLRRVSASYSGNAIDVRRSDNVTSSIGFDASGNLNTGSLLSFAYIENRFLYSNAFNSSSYWGLANSSITPNSILGPDSTTSASLYTVSAGGAGESFIRAEVTNLQINGVYTAAIYAKKGDLQYFRLRTLYADGGNGDCFFDLNTGLTASKASGQTTAMVDVGNGWYRCSVSTQKTYTFNYFDIGFSNGQSKYPTVSGTGYIANAQISSGSTTLPYLETTTNSGSTYLTTYVTQWYDQSGNNRHATQTATGSQPLIVSSGSLVTQNNRPSLYFRQTDLITMAGLHDQTNLDQYFVISSSDSVVAYPFGNGTTRFGPVGVPADGNAFIYANYGSPSVYTNGALFTGSTRGDVWNAISGKKVVVHQSASTSGWASYNLGSTGSIGLVYTSYVQELIAYTSSVSASRTFLENNINNYYSIYTSSNAGYVARWYDQSGNNRHATQTTTARQPLIVSSGSVYIKNTKPALGMGRRQLNATFPYNNSNTTIYNVFTYETGSNYFILSNNSISIPGGVISWASTNAYGAYRDGGFTGNYLTTGQYLGVNLYRTSLFESYANGSTAYTSSAGNITGSINISNIVIGDYPDYVTDESTLQELILYPNDQSVNRGATSYGINNYYNIYPQTSSFTTSSFAIYATSGSVSASLNNDLVSGISSTGPLGFITVSRTGSNSLTIARNGVTSSFAVPASGALSTGIFLGAINNNGLALANSPLGISFASVGTGLTANDLYNLNRLTYNLQSNLGRPDPNAVSFLTAANITDVTQSLAINTLVSDLKSYGIWDKMKVLYPFVGQPNVSSSFEFNLKNPNTFRGVFNGGWTFASTGIRGNGSTGYMSTGFIPSDNYSVLDSHVSFYTTTNAAGGFDMGGDDYPKQFSFSAKFTNNLAYVRFGNNQTTTAITDSNGYFVITQNSSLGLRGFRNRSSYITGTYYSDISTRTVNIGCTDEGGTRKYFSNREYTFASIGDGLTDTEAANLYTAVQRFQTTLGRQV